MKMGSVIVENGKKVLTMAEYIEREAISEEIRKYYYKNPPNFSYGEGFDRGLDRAQRAILDAPAADVAEVVHGTPVTEVRTRTIVGYHEEIGVLAGDRSTLYRRNMVHVDIPYDYCPVCGATLCSRWHNFCGKCGAKMDGGDGNSAMA